MAQNSEAVARQAELQLRQRISVVESEFSQVTSEAESKLASLRASLNSEAAQGTSDDRPNAAGGRASEARRGEFDALLQKTLDEWAQRSEAVLEAQSVELNRRAESTVAGMAERLQPVLETAGHETIDGWLVNSIRSSLRKLPAQPK